jgi:uncharacterized protein YaaN involved in tellurite resistance
MSTMSPTTEPSTALNVIENSAFAELVPAVKRDLAAHAPAPEEDQRRIAALLAEIDMADSNSILFFGIKAQEQLTSISDSMLEGVRSKDTGPAGEALNEMVIVLRGFNVDELNPNQQGFFSRLFNRAKPLAKLIQQYETVRNQIDTISNALERHKTRLLTDVASLDRLYDANLDYFHALELYIAAGQEKLRQLDQATIPALQQDANTTQAVIKAQELRDLRSARDDLERRVHDLRLTRQVTMQSLPSIRLVQENDKGLVNKINSTMVNTIPLWRQQLAQAITIYRSGQAAETVKAATDLTNELLVANAENLKQANAEVRKQIERGVFDIETVKKANATLIATIEESLQIADEGRHRRQEAAVQLQSCEAELRKTLAAAQARSSAKPSAGSS